METGQLNIETLTQLLNQQTFPASVNATLMTIRECSMLPRKDLSMLANRFIFCHVQSSSTQSQWKKTLNNIQELHTLDLLRQSLDNQTDFTTSARIFDTIFSEILFDSDHPLFSLYYNLLLKFLSLVISFESKVTLTIFARWLLTLPTSMESLISKIIEYIVHEHIALAMTKSINNLCLISPLFTLCFIHQTCLLLEQEKFLQDTKIIQTLIELITYGLTNSTGLLLVTLEQEFLGESNVSLFNFVPSMIRLDVLFPLRSSGSLSLSFHLDHFHTSILSFLFSIVMNPQNQILQKHLLPSNYFEQLPTIIQDASSPNQVNEESIQRYLQIFSICKISSLPLTQYSIDDLGKHFPLLTRHRLFDILKEKDERNKT